MPLYVNIRITAYRSFSLDHLEITLRMKQVATTTFKQAQRLQQSEGEQNVLLSSADHGGSIFPCELLQAAPQAKR